MSGSEGVVNGSEWAQPCAGRSLQSRVQISRGARIPELDGARGVAVLAVVIAHYFGEVDHGLFGFSFGWMGVSLFFVLSGFLIGSIILERKDSSISHPFSTADAHHVYCKASFVAVCKTPFACNDLKND